MDLRKMRQQIWKTSLILVNIKFYTPENVFVFKFIPKHKDSVCKHFLLHFHYSINMHGIVHVWIAT